MSFEIEILDSGERYACSAAQTLLGAMHQLGRRGIPLGCRSGGCGVCKVELLSGEVETGRMSRAHITHEEQAKGIVLACRACPRSAVQLRVLGHMQRVFGSNAMQSNVPTLRPAEAATHQR